MEGLSSLHHLRPRLKCKLGLNYYAIVAVAVVFFINSNSNLVSGFHLSFSKFLRSASNLPQLNPPGNLIRPIECRNANNHSEIGICMFSIDCMQNKGVPLSICKHNYFVGTCCRLPDHNNFVGIVYDLKNGDSNSEFVARGIAPPGTPNAVPVENIAAQDSEAFATTGVMSSFGSNNSAHYDFAITSNDMGTSAKLTSDQPSVDDKYMISSTSLFSSITPSPILKTSTLQADTAARTIDGLSNANSTESRETSDPPPSELRVVPILASSNPQYEIVKSELIPSQTSVYPVDDKSTNNSDDKLSQSVVLSNNHNPVTLAQKSTTSGLDNLTSQEFTVSSSPIVTQSTNSSRPFELPSSTVSLPVANEHVSVVFAGKQDLPSNSSQKQTNETAKAGGGAESAFVDLVSSSDSTIHTTTPFTTSISTAIIPNISALPLSSTSESPSSVINLSSSLVSSPHETSEVQLPSTTKLPSPSTTTHRPSQSIPSLSLGQFYTPSVAQDSSSIDARNATSSHSPRPSNLGPLQVATKIVTGNSVGNNLIPGLGGIHSTLMSHIPFKLSSLSNGLSSYLQSAMKPAGGRPLIFSNTAPSLSFQSQMLANSTATRSTQSTSPGSIRFPGSTSTESSTSGGIPLTTTPAPRDIMKEAQQVCGKPQKMNPASLGLTGDGAKKRVARIVGGNQSMFGQWPWMVSLRQWRKGAFLHKCGAALLNENWAITAAHCVENVKPSDLLLRLGEFDVSNQDEPYPYTERRVKMVVSHPLFDPKTFEYDLALLRFAEPVTFEKNVLPVCIPSGNDSYVDRIATVIGWGRLYEDGPLPDVIQHVDVPIITNRECEKMYKTAGYIEDIPNMFICAGISKGGRDSCEGDSGGPLTMVDNDGRSYLVGIISWGIGCALPSQPGVYTRITAFHDWIYQNAVN